MTPSPGSVLSSAPLEIRVTLNGNVDPLTANSASVKLVRDGPDNAFDTPDDVVVVPNGISLVGGNQVRIDLSGVLLANDTYRVTLLGNTPISSGRVAWWRLDETGGTVVSDSSGNGNHGTLGGNPQWQATAGKLGGALSFDGNGDFVFVPRSASLEPVSAISVSLWAHVLTVSSSWADILRKAGGGSPGYLVRWYHFDDRLQFRLDRNFNPPIYVPDTQTTSGYLNAWHHIAGTYDSVAGTAALYVDGILRNSLGGLSANLEHGDDLYLMFTNHGGQQALPGLLDDVRVYSRALSLREIQTLASGASDAAVTDPGGIPVDGEFGGGFPSGDGTAGGDFIATFSLLSSAPPPPPPAGGGSSVTNLTAGGCGLLGMEMLIPLGALLLVRRRRFCLSQRLAP